MEIPGRDSDWYPGRAPDERSTWNNAGPVACWSGSSRFIGSTAGDVPRGTASRLIGEPRIRPIALTPHRPARRMCSGERTIVPPGRLEVLLCRTPLKLHAVRPLRRELPACRESACPTLRNPVPSNPTPRYPELAQSHRRIPHPRSAPVQLTSRSNPGLSPPMMGPRRSPRCSWKKQMAPAGRNPRSSRTPRTRPRTFRGTPGRTTPIG